MKRVAKKKAAAKLEAPVPPANHVMWTRVGMIVTMTVAIGAAGFGLLAKPTISLLHSTDPLGPARQSLLASAKSVARAWQPDERERALARLAQTGDTTRLKAALRQALRERDQPLRRALLSCATALNAHEVRGEVFNIAFSGAAERGEAVRAAHQLEHWSRQELADFLRGQDVVNKLAALESIAKYGGELPEREWLDCLVSDDSDVRAAALRAMPQWPSSLLITEMEKVLAEGGPEGIAQIVRALARAGDPDRFEAVVVDLLGSPHDVVRKAALGFIKERDRQTQHAERIWSVVTDATATAELRAMALHTLERGNACPLPKLRAGLPLLGPLEQLFAARCLIAAGEPEALEILLTLLTGEQPEVAEAARRLLAWWTGANPAATAEEFRAALARQGRRTRRVLPEHGLALE